MAIEQVTTCHRKDVPSRRSLAPSKAPSQNDRKSSKPQVQHGEFLGSEGTYIRFLLWLAFERIVSFAEKCIDSVVSIGKQILKVTVVVITMIYILGSGNMDSLQQLIARLLDHLK